MRTRQFASITAALVLGMTTLIGGVAQAQNGRQKDKNNMRNLGIGLGAVAAHQAIKGKTTNALVLGAGALYAGKKYEDARKAQSKENNREYRQYRYRNGKRIGYYRIRNGQRIGTYELRNGRYVRA